MRIVYALLIAMLLGASYAADCTENDIADITCPAGQFLPIGAKTCSPCDAGSYSIGGGHTYSHWTSYGGWPRGFTTSCQGVNCTAWNIGSDIFIDSGDNSNAHNATSTLKLETDCENYFDYMDFAVDGVLKLARISAVTEWTRYYMAVPAGLHTFTWTYTKDLSMSHGEDRAYIQNIDVVGTRFAEPSCHPCPPGRNSSSGAPSCAACPRNTYAIGGNATCDDCPQHQWSEPGSSSCKAMGPCTADHIDKVTLPCVNGNRATYQKYLDPLVCDPTLPNSVQPNVTHVTEACPACPEGYINGDVCTECPHGEFLTPSNTCQICGGGYVEVKDVVYKFNRNGEVPVLPAEFRTSCVGDCGVAGWRVRDGFVDTGGEHGTNIELELTWSGDLEGDVHGLFHRDEQNINKIYMISFDAAIDCQDVEKSHCGLSVYGNNESLVFISGSSPLFRHYEYQLSHSMIRAGRHAYPNDPSRVRLDLTFMFEVAEPEVTLTETSAKLTNIKITTTKDVGSASSCSVCLAGSYSTPDHTVCQLCTPGTSAAQGSSSCHPCQNNTYSAKNGSAECLPCGSGTTAWTNATGCDINKCRFKHPEVLGLEYDLSALSRKDRMWGPVYDILNMEYYFNPCSTQHSNYSCHDIDGNPIATYACQITNHGYGLDIGSTLGYLPHPTTPDHGLIMTLDHGAPGCAPYHPRATNITFICDPSKGFGMPESPSAPIENPPASCFYDVEWRSLYACPLCTATHYHAVLGECNMQTLKRPVLYVWNTNPKECHDGVDLPPTTSTDCYTDAKCSAGQFYNGTACHDVPPGTYSPGPGEIYDGFGMQGVFPPGFATSCLPLPGCTPWHASDGVLISGSKYTYSMMSMMVTLIMPGNISFTYQTFGSTYRAGPMRRGFSVIVSGTPMNATWNVDDIFETEQVGVITLSKGTHMITFIHDPGQLGAHPMRIRDITVMGTRAATIDPIPCAPGSFARGAATRCTLCPANTVAHNSRSTECTACDEGHYEYSFPGESECRTRKPCTYDDVTFEHGACQLVGNNYVMLETAQFVKPHICYAAPNFIMPGPRNISCNTMHIPSGMFQYAGKLHYCPPGEIRAIGDAGCHPCPANTAAIPVMTFDDFSSSGVLPAYANWTTHCSGPHSMGIGWTAATSDPAHPAALYSGYYPGEEIDCIATLKVQPIAEYYDEMVLEMDYKLEADVNASSYLEYGIFVYVDKTPLFGDHVASSDMKHAVIKMPGNLAHSIEWDFYQAHIVDDEDVALGARATIYSITVTGVHGGGGVKCVTCDAGLFSLGGNRSICDVCSAGSYAPAGDHSTCMPCPSHSFSEQARSLKCEECGHGTANPPGHNYTDCSYSQCSLHPTDVDIGYDLSSLKRAEEYDIHIDGDLYAYLSLCSRDHQYHCVSKDKTRHNPFICLERRNVSGYVDIGRIISFEERAFDATTFDVSFNNPDNGFMSVIHFVCDTSNRSRTIEYSHIENNTKYHFTWHTEAACEPCRPDQLQVTKGDCKNGKRIVEKSPLPGVQCLRPASSYELCTPEKEATGVSGWTVGMIIAGFTVAGAAGFVYMNGKHRQLNSRYAQLLSSGKNASGFDARLIDHEDTEAQEVPTTTETSGDYTGPNTSM